MDCCSKKKKRQVWTAEGKLGLKRLFGKVKNCFFSSQMTWFRCNKSIWVQILVQIKCYIWEKPTSIETTNSNNDYKNLMTHPFLKSLRSLKCPGACVFLNISYINNTNISVHTTRCHFFLFFSFFCKLYTAGEPTYGWKNCCDLLRTVLRSYRNIISFHPLVDG